MMFVKIPRNDLYYWRDMCEFCLKTGKEYLILPIEETKAEDCTHEVRRELKEVI